MLQVTVALVFLSVALFVMACGSGYSDWKLAKEKRQQRFDRAIACREMASTEFAQWAEGNLPEVTLAD
jgi:hypothetical protein